MCLWLVSWARFAPISHALALLALVHLRGALTAGAICAIKSDQGTTRSISSRNSRRRVRFVGVPNPRLRCLMGSMVLGNQVGAKHMSERFMQIFPRCARAATFLRTAPSRGGGRRDAGEFWFIREQQLASDRPLGSTNARQINEDVEVRSTKPLLCTEMGHFAVELAGLLVNSGTLAFSVSDGPLFVEGPTVSRLPELAKKMTKAAILVARHQRNGFVELTQGGQTLDKKGQLQAIAFACKKGDTSSCGRKTQLQLLPVLRCWFSPSWTRSWDVSRCATWSMPVCLCKSAGGDLAIHLEQAHQRG